MGADREPAEGTHVGSVPGAIVRTPNATDLTGPTESKITAAMLRLPILTTGSEPVTSLDEFGRQVSALLADRQLLTHAFYQRWSAGTLAAA